VSSFYVGACKLSRGVFIYSHALSVMPILLVLIQRRMDKNQEQCHDPDYTGGSPVSGVVLDRMHTPLQSHCQSFDAFIPWISFVNCIGRAIRPSIQAMNSRATISCIYNVTGSDVKRHFGYKLYLAVIQKTWIGYKTLIRE
jgi:hypothetical protein